MTWRAVLLVVLVIPGCWYASLAVHEGGHVIAAALTGAHRIDVTLPIVGFSHTLREPDLHPRLTTAAGLVLGMMVPLVLWVSVQRWGHRSARVLQMWAGFALVLNGAYGAADALLLGGDSGQLIRHGIPAAALVGVGTLVTAAGLWVWHRLDREAPVGRGDFCTAGVLLVTGVLSFVVW